MLERGKRIFVYRNGDIHFTGRRILVSQRLFKTWESFLRILSVEFKIMATGSAVRKFIDLETGRPINSLEEIEDGRNYVAAGTEPFKNVSYRTLRTADLHKEKARLSQRAARVNAEKRGSNRSVVNVHKQIGRGVTGDSGDVEDPIFEPTSRPYRVLVFQNGQATHSGVKLVLNFRNCRSWDHFLTTLTVSISLPTGRVRRVYDAVSGVRIRKLTELKDGVNLVAAGNEALKKAHYQIVNDIGVGQPGWIRSRFALTTASEHGGQEDEVRIATFYPNGDAWHGGVRVTINKIADLRKVS
ncbi:hypothetical protein M427DRAFT_99120 [Gonapodya prolifera JEL478]|uniref:Doublecortin domain-containing protein n=1 Tax=Gonapodya prolifera (strain JEL478) TaxID=1344416 RepID=A0A139AEJ1_GONPJ|nr:hypothetical protein M427DRAFT_99120 [Gonapodya prolifera JEL478]|eukprot:KXS15187.1 hypothetical protein M427DRAFT_99120 [Gonapodya prolifera JEL478]